MTKSQNTPHSAPHRVRVLDEPVARRIAAGEVIDRPYAAVRELLDNAIDSGPNEVVLRLLGGGIDEVRVTDDGGGMTRDDLEICCLPHATSKIASLNDLDKTSTLGFRGEALSSMAACSKLEIISRRGEDAFRLSIQGGKMSALESGSGAPGTTVSVKDLFYNMPARRRFLKSSRAEQTLCRRIFSEKTAAHPRISFRLFCDGNMKLFLPAGTPKQRVEALWPRLGAPGIWWETRADGDGFSVTVVHARPESSRRDRQYIHIYANRRRIDEFSMVQGVQYAYDAWMPGGAFPMAFVFVEIDPALVDFNIHPAKKEARFRDGAAVRHRLIEAIKDRITAETYKRRGSPQPRSVPMMRRSPPDFSDDAPPPPPSSAGSIFRHAVRESAPAYSTGRRPAAAESAETVDRASAGAFGRAVAEAGKLERFSPVPLEKGRPFTYLGRTMGVFLLAESEGSLFMVDQHAAHERVLFERFCSEEPASDTLLIPRPLDLDAAAGMKLELRKDRLEKLGIGVTKEGSEWTLCALPRAAAGMEAEVAEFLEAGGGDADGLEKELWADLACKAAVKDNDVLDETAAVELLREAFALDTPRCPHGRPLWFEISRRELFELVGRIV